MDCRFFSTPTREVSRIARTFVAVGCLSLLLAGCGSADEAKRGPDSPSGSGGAQSQYNDLPEVRVDAQGKRSFPEQTHEETLDIMWSNLIDDLPEGSVAPERPSVQLVAFHDTMEPYVDCLKQQGWGQVKYLADVDQLEIEIPQDQAVAYGLASYVCYGQHPKKMRPPMNEDEIAALWQFSVDHSIPCLSQQGYSVTGFPSKESFIDRYFAQRTYQLPHDLVDAPREILERCPLFPEQSRS